jgi:hypothetical protein
MRNLVVRARVEGLRLGDWRREYLQAARSNDVAAMRRLITQLSTHVPGSNVPSDAKPRTEVGSWQHLCAQAQHEQDAGKLLQLVAEINRLLEEEQKQEANALGARRALPHPLDQLNVKP